MIEKRKYCPKAILYRIQMLISEYGNAPIAFFEKKIDEEFGSGAYQKWLYEPYPYS